MLVVALVGLKQTAAWVLPTRLATSYQASVTTEATKQPRLFLPGRLTHKKPSRTHDKRVLPKLVVSLHAWGVKSGVGNYMALFAL